MAKKIVAITAIKGSDVYVEPGQVVNADQFSKEELKALYDNGAIEVKDSADEKTEKVESAPDTTVKATSAKEDGTAGDSK